MPDSINSEQLSGALDKLLKNPELLQNMLSIFSGMGNANGESNKNSESNADDNTTEKTVEASVNSETDRHGSENNSSPLGAILSNPELMSKLPEAIAALSPMLGEKTALKSDNTYNNIQRKSPPDKRLALLIALKPYLSHGRCEAIDYIMKINKLGSLFKSLSF